MFTENIYSTNAEQMACKAQNKFVRRQFKRFSILCYLQRQHFQNFDN